MTSVDLSGVGDRAGVIIWEFSSGSSVPKIASSDSAFGSGSVYMVLHTEDGGAEKPQLLYAWTGAESSKETHQAADALAAELASKFGAALSRQDEQPGSESSALKELCPSLQAPPGATSSEPTSGNGNGDAPNGVPEAEAKGKGKKNKKNKHKQQHAEVQQSEVQQSAPVADSSHKAPEPEPGPVAPEAAQPDEAVADVAAAVAGGATAAAAAPGAPAEAATGGGDDPAPAQGNEVTSQDSITAVAGTPERSEEEVAAKGQQAASASGVVAAVVEEEVAAAAAAEPVEGAEESAVAAVAEDPEGPVEGQSAGSGLDADAGASSEFNPSGDEFLHRGNLGTVQSINGTPRTSATHLPTSSSEHDRSNTANASLLLSVGTFKLKPLQDFVPYDELVKMRLEDGIDATRREDYLDDDEFIKVFEMDRAAYTAMPAWKKQQAKKKVHLF